MLVEHATRFAYPAFSRYLEQACRSAANTPQIVRGLVRFGEMNEERVRAILTTSTPPIVGVAALTGSDLGRYSLTTFRIDVAQDVADRYENDPAARNDIRMQRLIVAVLMHEIVHWGDAKLGAYRGEGPAHAFDRAVFHGRVARHW